MFWVRYFNEEQSKLTRTVFNISFYFPTAVKQVIFDNRMDDEDYMLCPLYPPSNGNPNGDFQIGITGKLEQRVGSRRMETDKEGIDRELKEEVGIQANSYQNILPSVNMGKWKAYILKITDTLPTNGGSIPIISGRGRGRDSRHVGCIVYGKGRDIRKYMDSDVKPYDDEDNIVGVVAVKLKNIKQYVISGQEHRR